MKTLTKNILSIMALMLLSFSAQALEVGDKAPCLTLEGVEVDGSAVNRCVRDPNAASVGKRYAIIKFFSVHCSACSRMHEQFASNVNANPSIFENASIHYVSKDSKSEVTAYLNKEVKSLSVLEATIFMDTHREFRAVYGVLSTPTLLVIDRENEYEVVLKHIGLLNQASFEALVRTVQ